MGKVVLMGIRFPASPNRAAMDTYLMDQADE